MYAVIRTGGKQYKVAPQDVLQIEKIEGAAGETVSFSDVLMIAGEGEPSLGAPLVSGASVSAEVVEQVRGPKIVVFKKKRRNNYRRKKGHRQELTKVRILEILTGGSTSRAKAAGAPEGGAKKVKKAAAKSGEAPISEAQAEPHGEAEK